MDLVEKKPKGIFPMLDEECYVPKGSDMGLMEKLAETHRKNDAFDYKRKKGVESVFTVNHYAGGVCYDVTGFLDKNRDLLQARTRERHGAARGHVCCATVDSREERREREREREGGRERERERASL